MSRSFIGRLIVATLGSVTGALTFVVFPVLAGNPALAASRHGYGIFITHLQTATPTAGTATILTADNFIPFLLILFLFGLLLIAGLLFYIYRIQLKYYAAAQRLSQMGVGVKATLVPSTIEKGFAPTEKVTLMIDGPGFVAVGAQADYTATFEKALGATTIPSGDVTWSSDPPDAASVNPKTGSKVSVVPLKKGPFLLTATLDTIKSSASVTAVDPPASEDLPFIGQGFGSLVITVLVVVAIILLALTNILTGEAVATLFGGLLGYIFGVATSTAATSSKKADGKSPGASS